MNFFTTCRYDYMTVDMDISLRVLPCVCSIVLAVPAFNALVINIYNSRSMFFCTAGHSRQGDRAMFSALRRHVVCTLLLHLPLNVLSNLLLFQFFYPSYRLPHQRLRFYFRRAYEICIIIIIIIIIVITNTAFCKREK